VRYFDRGTNMHSLWDSGWIERMSRSEDYWIKELTVLPSAQSPEMSAEGTVEDWATESLLAAREAHVGPVTGQRIKSGTKLGLDYHTKNIPVVKERMYLAGIRLAKVLNEAFPEK
jgi:nuclease S1